MDSPSSTEATSSDQPRNVLPLIIVGAIGIVVGYVVAEKVNEYEQQAAIEVNWSYAPAKHRRDANKVVEPEKAQPTTAPTKSTKSTR
jgi:hypothetical protein